MSRFSLLFVWTVIIFNLGALQLSNTARSLHQLNRPDKLKVSIYITSLCKDTKKFLINDFIPSYFNGLKDYIDVEFIPWGKTKRTEEGVSCQFGEEDCVANKIQSCALHYLRDQESQVHYIGCEFVNMFSTVGNLQCAVDAGIPYETINHCFQSRMGDDLQRQAELATQRIPLNFVPTIVYNDRFDETVQRTAFEDFRGKTCELLQETFPGICDTI